MKEIYPHFAKDDALWEAMLNRNRDHNVYAWQTGHQRSTNVSTYGLDQTFPSRLQPELINEYIRISRIWQIFGKVWNGPVTVHVEKTVNRRNEVEMESDGGSEMANERALQTPKRKRHTVEVLEIEGVDSANISPESKRLLDMQRVYAKLFECRRTQKALKEKYNISN